MTSRFVSKARWGVVAIDKANPAHVALYEALKAELKKRCRGGVGFDSDGYDTLEAYEEALAELDAIFADVAEGVELPTVKAHLTQEFWTRVGALDKSLKPREAGSVEGVRVERKREERDARERGEAAQADEADAAALALALASSPLTVGGNASGPGHKAELVLEGLRAIRSSSGVVELGGLPGISAKRGFLFVKDSAPSKVLKGMLSSVRRSYGVEVLTCNARLGEMAWKVEETSLLGSLAFGEVWFYQEGPAEAFKGHFTSKEPQESGWVHLGSGKPSEAPPAPTAAPAPVTSVPVPQVVPPAVEAQASPPSNIPVTALPPEGNPAAPVAPASTVAGTPSEQGSVQAAPLSLAARPSACSEEMEKTMNLDIILGILAALQGSKDLKDVALYVAALRRMEDLIRDGASPSEWVESRPSDPFPLGVCASFDKDGNAALLESGNDDYSIEKASQWFDMNLEALKKASSKVAMEGILKASVELAELAEEDEDIKFLRSKFLGNKTLNLGAVDARGAFNGNKVRAGLEKVAQFFSTKTGFEFKVNVDGKFQVPQVAFERGSVQQVGFKTLEGLPLDWFAYEGGVLSLLSTVLGEVVPGQNNEPGLEDLLGTVVNLNEPLRAPETPRSQPRLALANFALRGNLWTSTARAAQMFTVKGKNGKLHTNGQEIYSRISSVFVDGAVELVTGKHTFAKAKEPARVFLCDYSSPATLLRGLWEASALHFGLYRLVGAIKGGAKSESPDPTPAKFEELGKTLVKVAEKAQAGSDLSKDEQRLLYLAMVLCGKGKAAGIDGLMLVGKGILPEKLLDQTTYQFRLEGVYGEATKALHAACLASSSGGHGEGGELALRVPQTIPSMSLSPDETLVRSEVAPDLASPEFAGPIALAGFKSEEEFNAYGRTLPLNAIVRWLEERMGEAFQGAAKALQGRSAMRLSKAPEVAAPGLLGAAIAALETVLGPEKVKESFGMALQALALGGHFNPAESLFGKGAARREAYLRDGVLLVDINITKQANKAQWKTLTKKAVIELPLGSKLLYGVFMTQGIGNTRASHQGEQYGASVMTSAFLRELPLDLLKEVAKDVLGVDELPAPAPVTPAPAQDEQRALIAAINKYGQVPFFGPATAKALHLVMGLVREVLVDGNPKAWLKLKAYAKGMRHAADGCEQMGGEIDDRAQAILKTETPDGEESVNLDEAVGVFDAAFARSKETREFLVDFNQAGPRKAMLEVAYRALRNVTTTPPNRFSSEMETFFGVEAYLTDLNAVPSNEPNSGLSKVEKGILTVEEMFGTPMAPEAAKTLVLTPDGVRLMTTKEAASFDGQLKLMVVGQSGKVLATRRVPVIYGIAPRLFANIGKWAKANVKDGLATYAAIGFIYRYPIASADNISPALMVDLQRFFPDLDLPVGYYANSKTIKENLCGDTDGDKLNFMPLGVNFELSYLEGSDLYQARVALDTVDSLQVFQYTAISVAPAPSIEDFTGRTSTSPRTLKLYETEKYIDISQSLIGPSALMQQINNNLRIALKVVKPRPMAKTIEGWDKVYLSAGRSRESYKVSEFAKAFGRYSDFSEKPSDFLTLLVEQVMFFDVQVEEKSRALATKRAQEQGKTLDWEAKPRTQAAREAFSALHKAKMDIIYGEKGEAGRQGGLAKTKTQSRQEALGYVNSQLLPPAGTSKTPMAAHAGKVLFAVLRDQVMLPLSTFLPVILETGGISSQKKDTIDALMWAFSEMLFDSTHVGDNGEVIWIRPKPVAPASTKAASPYKKAEVKGYPSLWATMRPYHAWNKGEFMAYPVLNFYTDWAKSLRRADGDGEEETFDLRSFANVKLYDSEDGGEGEQQDDRPLTVRTNSALGKALFTIGLYMMFHSGQNYESSLGGNGRIEGGNRLFYRQQNGPDPMRNEDGSLRMTFPEGTRPGINGGPKQTSFEDVKANPAAILFGARNSNEKLFPFNPEVVMKLGGMVRDVLQALCTSFEDEDSNENTTYSPLEFPSPNALPAMVEKDRRELITRRLGIYVSEYNDEGERILERAGTFGPWKMFFDATPSATNAKGRLQARVVEKWAGNIEKALGGSSGRSRFNAQGATTLEFPLDKGKKALEHVNALTFSNDATPVTALVQLQAQVAEQTKGLREGLEEAELRQAVEMYAKSHLWEVALTLPSNVEKQLETTRLTAAGKKALPSWRHSAEESLMGVLKSNPAEMALFGLLGSVTMEVVATKLAREAKNLQAVEAKLGPTEQAMMALLVDLPNRIFADANQANIGLGKVAGLQALLSLGTFTTKFGLKQYTGVRSEFGAVASLYLAKLLDEAIAKAPEKVPSDHLKGILASSPTLKYFRRVWGVVEVEAALLSEYVVDQEKVAQEPSTLYCMDINAIPEVGSRMGNRNLLQDPSDAAWGFVQLVERLNDPKERATTLSLAMAKAARNSFKEMTKELSKENLRRLYEFSMYRFPAPGKAASSSADNFRHSAELLALHKALLEAKAVATPVNVFQVVVPQQGQPKFQVVKKELSQLAYEHYINARTNRGRSDGLLMAVISENFSKAVSCVEGIYGIGIVLESPEKLGLFNGDILGHIPKPDNTGMFVPLKLGRGEEGGYIERVSFSSAKNDDTRYTLAKEMAFGVPVSVYVDKDGNGNFSEEFVGWLVGSNRLPAMAGCGYVVMDVSNLYDAANPLDGLHLYDSAKGDRIESGTRFSPWAAPIGSKENGATVGSVLASSKRWLVDAHDASAGNGKGATSAPRFLAVAEDFVPGLVEEFVFDAGILAQGLYADEASDLVDADGNPTMTKEAYVKAVVVDYLGQAGFSIKDFYPEEANRFDIIATFEAVNEEALEFMNPFHVAAIKALFPKVLNFRVTSNRKGLLRANLISDEGLKALVEKKEEEAKEAQEEAALSQNGANNNG